VVKTVGRSELRLLIEDVVCRELGADAVARSCPRCGSSEHGRPRLRTGGDPPYLSLSYTGDLAVAAWTWDGPIGVDIERVGPPVGEFGDRREWTRTEAVLKATGEGLIRDPSDLPDLWTAPLPLPPGWVGTVAVAGVENAEFSWRTAGPAAAGH
jgi:4'-phosphopantetheinyl transferase